MNPIQKIQEGLKTPSTSTRVYKPFKAGLDIINYIGVNELKSMSPTQKMALSLACADESKVSEIRDPYIKTVVKAAIEKRDANLKAQREAELGVNPDKLDDAGFIRFANDALDNGANLTDKQFRRYIDIKYNGASTNKSTSEPRRYSTDAAANSSRQSS